MTTEPDKRVAIPPADTGIGIQVRALVKRFDKREVLRGLDFDIRQGDFVSIVGRSGCGKSTLLRLLAGLESITNGRVDFDGIPRAHLSNDIRMMFQDARLLPWRTVIENVALGLAGEKDEIDYAARNALDQVGLADRAEDWPGKLSGGQRQRVALARALIHRPRLLLLDEPLGALDALTRLEMQRLIERIWRQHGFTAVLVTHDVAEAVALSDRILIIEDGVVTYDEQVRLERPRAQGQPEFAALESSVLKHLMSVPVSNGGNQARGTAANVRSETTGPEVSVGHVLKPASLSVGV